MNRPPAAGPKHAAAESRRGLWAAVAGFAVWGAIPLYFRPLHALPPPTIVAHRLLGCCLLVCGGLAVRGELGAVRAALSGRETRRRLVASAALISVNWLVYVWAIGAGHVVDASLGYFVNPLVNVLFGVVLLGERLRPVRWVAVGFGAAGVAWLTVQSGHLPWIALALAFSFGGYGLLRKVMPVGAIVGLASETLLLAPLGLGWLGCQALGGAGAFGGATRALGAWLLLSGPITAVALGLFAYGARRIPYSTIGVIQFINPSLQLLCGIFVFGEPFPTARAAGFALIWTALAIYAGDGLRSARRPYEPARAGNVASTESTDL